MGSMGNFPPYNGYRDCSQGICSIYCPQWCYIIFPPPPPFQSGDDDSGMNFSPLIIVVIGILASAFVLVSYYTVISKTCQREETIPEIRNESTNQWQHATTGLDESLIKSIAVCKFRKGDGAVDGSDCAICLGEFQQGETLRVLPKCNHAFHLPCIDMWLGSHSSCPLCRSHVMPGIATPFQPPLQSSSINLNAFHRRNDLVLVVEPNHHVDQVVEILPKYTFHEHQDTQEITRSVSNISIAEILRIGDRNYADHHLHQQVGPSEGENSKSTNTNVSTGRFMFTKNDKGKSSILPNSGHASNSCVQIDNRIII